MTEVELQKQRQEANNAAQLAKIQQSSAYQSDHAALLAGGSGPATPRAPQQTDFSAWAAGLEKQAGGPRVKQDPTNALGGYDPRDGRSPDYAPAQHQQMLDQGFTHDENTGGYWKVTGNSPAAGSGSGTPAAAVDAGGAPSGGAGDGLSASMASLTGAAPAVGQALQEPGGSLLRPTLVTRHPAVMSASLAQLGKAY